MLLNKCRYFGLSILLFGNFEGYAQDSVFARQFIQTLCQTEMYGRNASHQGERKVADFIAKTMQEHHLKPFDSTYFQPVFYANKAYNGAVTLKINDLFLTPFEDFVIAPESKCEAVCAEVVLLRDSTFFSSKYKKNYENKFLVIDLTQFEDKNKVYREIIDYALKNKALGVIFTVDAFRPYRVAEFQDYKDLMLIEVKKTAFPKKVSKICLTGTTHFIPNYQTRNVVSYCEGTAAKDSFIVITAHYDHLGTMGDNTIFYGANDNASGVALMMDFAKTLQQDSLKYTVVFIAFCGEEMGLKGSKFFVENPLIDLSKIKMTINFDLLCAGNEGITVVNGRNLPKKMELLTKINDENKYLAEITLGENAPNSDHYWFTTQDVPAIFIYAKGKTGKGHHPDDTCENCPLSGYNAIFKLFYQFIKALN
ncbi:MAG: M20/M25/M40 family metallo-hydrolase [Lentimicrobiaceae bacterium]|nr:M20/M25/M40 family metallo-hydrolase [Lentimicrobiaceae bacterium]